MAWTVTPLKITSVANAIMQFNEFNEIKHIPSHGKDINVAASLEELKSSL